MRHTYFPARRERSIRGAHPDGYQATTPGAPLRDLTVFDPPWAWSAGQLVSTPRDLNRFIAAFMDGRLLKAEQLREMRTTAPR
ncbi:hypothetical protein AB0A94_03095 [Streptomyces sp. NPDC044984]|uniref:hypothetical protein n=1 Tax=Streptomyces sp. NPDC044984 TaxID=3154335 RepID=UPI0033D62120